MSFTDRKLEIAILALSITMIGGLGYVLKTPVQRAIVESDIVYEMPRIKKSFLASLFDLGDREVDRSYTNPFAKKKAEERKKAEEAKKAQAVAAAKAAAKPVAKKAAETKKPTVEVKTVEATPAKKWEDDGFFGGSSPAANQVVNNGNTNTDSDGEKSDMTRDQWQALLRAQPTAENVQKLIAAFANEEIDEETFYAVVADLFSSNKAETQALGLVAVKSFYSPKSFALTTQHLDQFTPELEDKARGYLNGYAVSGRLGILASVLKTSDIEIVTMAARVVMDGYQNAKNGTNTNTDPRNSRGNVVTNSLSSYAQLIPVFRELLGHQDSAIANLASSALTQLQQSAVAAL